LKFAPVSWLASKDLLRLCGDSRLGCPGDLARQAWNFHFCPGPSQIIPVAPVLCPRLQLRGSAGFAPASLSSSSEEDARTYFRKP